MTELLRVVILLVYDVRLLKNSPGFFQGDAMFLFDAPVLGGVGGVTRYTMPGTAQSTREQWKREQIGVFFG